MGSATLAGNLHSVAYGAAEATRPTTPALGSNITHSGDWTEAPCFLDEGEISMSWRDERITFDPPASQAPLKDIIIKNCPDAFDIPLQEIGADPWVFDSSAATGSGTDVTFGTTVTYKALLLCFNGVGMLYFPKCFVKVMTITVGKTSYAKTVLHVEPRGTDTVPAGVAYYEYDGT